MDKKRILVIDDEERFVQGVKANLEGTGKYEVLTETKGSQGLEAARRFKPDVIFLDIIMLDMSGDEVATMLKNDAALKSTPVIFLTAVMTKKEEKDTGGVIAGYSFLAKPVTVNQLIKSIEEILKKPSKQKA